MNLFAADIGNTRIKWGRCSPDRVLEVVSLPPEISPEWLTVWREWNPLPGALWGVAGVHPVRRDALVLWLREQLQDVRLIADYRQLPIAVNVDSPEKVGIDRLLNAVGIRVFQTGPEAAILIDAGSAVTVDYVDGDQVFQGGAIFPGPLLMARVLNEYTAKLPFVEDLHGGSPAMPGRNTRDAIQAGILAAFRGGVENLVQELRGTYGPADAWLAGGYARLLIQSPDAVLVGSELTLEGIRLSLLHGLSGTR